MRIMNKINPAPTTSSTPGKPKGVEEYKMTLRERLASWGSTLKRFLVYCYNNETHEVIGRDGLSWFKISMFYFAFYLFLALFFAFCTWIFFLTVSQTTPTYPGQYSCMGRAEDPTTGKRVLNPGLGHRPQLNVESSLIKYTLSNSFYLLTLYLTMWLERHQLVITQKINLKQLWNIFGYSESSNIKYTLSNSFYYFKQVAIVTF